jgi:hypothetical protein
LVVLVCRGLGPVSGSSIAGYLGRVRLALSKEDRGRDGCMSEVCRLGIRG